MTHDAITLAAAVGVAMASLYAMVVRPHPIPALSFIGAITIAITFAFGADHG